MWPFEKIDLKGMETEFRLIFCLLSAFVIIIFLILIIPLGYFFVTLNSTADTIMELQREYFTVLVAAFSAWIGAGAAFYFSKDTSQKMLDMRDLPPIEKLRKTAIRDLPPNKIEWTVQRTEKIENIFDKLKKEVKLWFIPVVKKDGSIDSVIHEEGVYRYILAENAENKKIVDQTVENLLAWYEEKKMEYPDLYDKVLKGWVTANQSSNVGYAEDRMTEREVDLTIVIDDNRKPLAYITAENIKQCLLRKR